MKNELWSKFMNYIDNIEDLTKNQRDELVKYAEKLNEEDAIKLGIFIDGFGDFYNYRLIKETLEDIINNTLVTGEMSDKKEPEIIEFEDDEDDIEFDEEEEFDEEDEVKIDTYKDLYDEIKRLNPDAEFKFDDSTGFAVLYSSVDGDELELPEPFYYNEKNGVTNKHMTESGAYKSLEVRPLVKEEELKEEPKKGIGALLNAKKEEDIEDDFDDEEIEEEENEVEETKEPKKIGPFKKFYYNHIKKYKYVDEELEPIEIEEAEEKKGFFRRLADKIKSKFSKNKDSKIEYINKFIEDNYSDNDEIATFMDLLEEREDKDKIVNKLYRFIKHSFKAYDEDEFVNKLYKLFGLLRDEEEKEEKIEKELKELKKEVEEKEEKEEIEEVEEKEEEPKKIEFKTPEKVEVKEEVKKVARDITKLGDSYKESMNELRSKFTDIEIMFIDDAHSECLEFGDPEFEQMLNERCIDKRRIYRYLLEAEKIRLLSVYNNLDQYEKMFIDDALAETLDQNDQEFDQMANERNINKEVIVKYFEILTKSKEKQNKMIASCKKEFLKLNDVDFEDKKVKELKEIAKENNMEKTSKMKKEELIKMLNELKKMKEQDLNERLGLTK